MTLIACALYWPSRPANASQELVNSWTNSGSGNWEAANWSLGVLPGGGQLILLTNAGWKAVAIGANTAQNYTQSLAVASITIAAPANSFNELLLNYAGLQTPLLTTQLVIQSNAALVSLHSALQVAGSSNDQFEVGGTFIHGAESQVNAYILNVGDLAQGAYFMTNGTLSVQSDEIIGGVAGSFQQEGGINSAGRVLLENGGNYYLLGGQLQASVVVGPGNAAGPEFFQLGGVVGGTVSVGSGGLGSYLLAGGVISGSMSVPDAAQGSGSVTQTGGTNLCGLSIGNPFGLFSGLVGSGSYTLSNGVIQTTQIAINGAGTFTQWGGNLIDYGTLDISGTQVALGDFAFANYALNDGALASDALNVQTGSFSQSGGTNQIGGDLNVGNTQDNSSYALKGGLLTEANCTVLNSFNGGFFQSGGEHVVAKQLTVSQFFNQPEYHGYVLSGGELIAPNIMVNNGAIFQQTGGNIVQDGLLTLADGIWITGPGQQPLGQLLLATAAAQQTNSSLVLPNASCLLSFANSSTVTWSNQAVLTIEHWNGCVTGGGSQQIFVGSDSSGLTPQQLTQIQFDAPNGTAGMYPAMILQTGEIVPTVTLTPLGLQRISSSLVIKWGAGRILQSSTNAFGPFEDVTGASSPYIVSLTEPQRFFRLR